MALKKTRKDLFSPDKTTDVDRSAAQSRFQELRSQLITPEPDRTTPQSRFQQLRRELLGDTEHSDPNGESGYQTANRLWQQKEAEAQQAQQDYQQAAQQADWQRRASPNLSYLSGQPTATGSPYGAAQQDPVAQMDEAGRTLHELGKRAKNLQQEATTLKGQATYAKDMQAIASMPWKELNALGALADDLTSGGDYRPMENPLISLWEKVTGQNITTKTESLAKREESIQTLRQAGYTGEQIQNLAETYSQYRNQIEAAQRQRDTREAVNSSAGAAVAHNLLAVPANIVGAIAGAAGTADEAMRRGIMGSQYESLDPNLEAYKYSDYASTVRSQTRENIEEGNGIPGKIGGFLYGAATSAVDNLSRIAAAGPAGSLALAGMSSFQDSVRDVSSRGGTAAQAYGMGVTSAAFEILTEKVSLDNLIDTPSPTTIAQALKNAAIQGGIEVSEEELNFAAGTIADAMIMGEQSDIRQQYHNLIASGASPQDAAKQVTQGLLMDAVNVAAESFLSGSMMSAGTQTKSYLKNRLYGTPEQPSTGIDTSTTPPPVGADAHIGPPADAQTVPPANTSATAKPDSAAADTVNRALEAFKAGGTVSNSTASRILATPGAVEYLQQSVEFQLPGTASGNRAAVKYAVEMLATAQEQSQELNSQLPNPDDTPDVDRATAQARFEELRRELLGDSEQPQSGNREADNNGTSESQGQQQAGPGLADAFWDIVFKRQPSSTKTGKERVSRVAQTAKEAPSAAGDMADLIDTAKVNGDLSYYQIPNSVSTQRAAEFITRRGWKLARMDWTAAVRSGRVSAETTAIGALLLNNAAKAGDKVTYLETLKDFRAMATNAAQATQAVRILKQLAPDDRLYMIQRSIDDIVEHARLPKAIIIPEELKAQYLSAKTEEARDRVINKIQQYVADQLQSSLIEQFNALRYLNMLGNFKTQGRNLLGNVGMQLVSEAQNAVCVGLEAIANKATGGKYQRTRSILVNTDLYKAARADFSKVQDIAMGGGKYENKPVESFAKGVQEKRTILRGILRPLELYRRVTNWAMEKGDKVFSRHSYARALAGYLKARGIKTAEQFSKMSEAKKDEARTFAIREAQEKTFRDSNRISDWAAKVGRRPDTPLAVRLLAEGEAPYRKTGANIVVRTEEYSPVGLINTIIEGAKALNPNSEVTAQDFLNSASKTLTGTGIFFLGMLLYNMGFLTGAPDDDRRQAAFDEAVGKQPYSLQFPDGSSYTFDWAAPLAIPLFMGAELKKLIDQQDIDLKDIETAALSLSAPLIDMTTLQTVDSISTKLRYADGDWGEVFLSTALSFLTQGLSNNLLRQIESGVQKEATTTYVDPESDIPEWMQRAIGNFSRSVPGWDYQQVPYRDKLGKTEDSGGLLYNLFSPGYLDKTVLTPGRKERQRLADALGDTSVLYTTPTGTVSVMGEERALTAQEYDRVKGQHGTLAESIVGVLISRDGYDDLSDEGKSKAIKDAYKYAEEKVKQDLIAGADDFSTQWMREVDSSSARSISAAILERHLDKEKTTITGMTDLQYAKAEEAGFSTESMTYMASLLGALTPEEGHERVSLSQQMEAITGSPKLSEGEKEEWLYWLLNDKQDKKLDAAKDLGLSAEDYAVAYRLYSIETNTGGKGTKNRIVSGLMEKFDLDRKTAESLYKIYNGSYDN